MTLTRRQWEDHLVTASTPEELGEAVRELLDEMDRLRGSAIAQRCAIRECHRPFARDVEWPDTHTRVSLCAHHVIQFDAR